VPDTSGLLSQLAVQIDGAPAPDEFVDDLVAAVIENSLHLPDVATVTLNDSQGKWVDDDRVGPGKNLKIDASLVGGRQTIFEGEVVELEPEYVPGHARLVLRAFDKMHRLARGKKVRSFQNVNDGDLIERIGKEAGLQVKVGETSQVHAYVLQDNETNLAFLQKRAADHGYLLYVRGNTLHCEPPGHADAGPIELHWGQTLTEFRPRLTTIGQSNSAIVRGWDPEKRQVIVGQARNGRGAPQTDDSRSGSQIAQSAFNMTTEAIVTDRPVRSQAEADRIAQSMMDRTAANFIVAEGVAVGNPRITGGASIKLNGLGKRFDGTYFVTGVSHEYGHGEGYVTRFFVSGHRPSTLLGLLRSESDGSAGGSAGGGGGGGISGLVVGIVTDNQDTNGQGRVKVRYPTLSDEHASDWARLVALGGGPERGFEFVPEVNDEVIVGFEHGDVHHPYVLGGLWNGKDAPPKKSDQLISGGKVQQRIIRSRLGHTITLDDSDDKPSITIVDKTGKNTIKLESSTNNLTVSVEGDLSITAKQKVSIKGQSVEVNADNSLTLKGTSADIEAQGGLTLKGATADLQASGTATVKGSTVSIN
jgi:phage protein D/phage baseplate assembly protein gpV